MNAKNTGFDTQYVLWLEDELNKLKQSQKPN